MTSFHPVQYDSNWDRTYYTEVIESDLYDIDPKTFNNWSGEVASWNYEENTKMEESLKELDIYMQAHLQYIRRRVHKDRRKLFIYTRNTKIIQKYWIQFKTRSTP